VLREYAAGDCRAKSAKKKAILHTLVGERWIGKRLTIACNVARWNDHGKIKMISEAIAIDNRLNLRSPGQEISAIKLSRDGNSNVSNC
jgi:hypothetical protein